MRQEQSSADGNKGDFDVQIALIKMGHQIESILKAIGEPNDTETGGVGLAGRMARIETSLGEKIEKIEKRVDHLYGIKQIGVGLMLAVSGLSLFIIDGFKTWIHSVWDGKSAPL